MTPQMLLADLASTPALGKLLQAKLPAQWPPEDFAPYVMEMILRQALDSPEKCGWHRYMVWQPRPTEATLVGCIGAFPKPDNIAELGYSTLPEFQRRGFATEAARCLIEYLFQQNEVRAVRAQAFTHAEASLKVMQRAGLHPAGSGDDPGTLQYLLER